jgi:hypothetical protein
VSLRERGIKPRSVNTYLQCMNAFGMWLHQEHGRERVRLPLLKVERRVLVTLTEAQIRPTLLDPAAKPRRAPLPPIARALASVADATRR